MNLQELVSSFKNYKIGFVAFEYTNSHSEKSKLLIDVGFNYGNMLKSDLETLHTEIKPNIQKYIGTENLYSVEQFNKVVLAIEKSLTAPDTERSNGQKEAYITLTENGALKYNMEKQSIKLFGVIVRKNIITEGVYPIVNSRPETLLRKKIEKDLRKSKIRSYTLENIQSIKMNGETLEIGL